MADDDDFSTKSTARTKQLDAVDLANLASHAYNVGVIWMVQVSYRLWAHVGKDEFGDVHRAWWYGPHGIKPVFIPSAVAAFFGAFAPLRRHPTGTQRAAALLGIGLQATTYIATAMTWGRWQGRLRQVRLEDGTLDPLYVRLLSTHWLRVGLITAAATVQFGLALTVLRDAAADKTEHDPAHRQ